MRSSGLGRNRGAAPPSFVSPKENTRRAIKSTSTFLVLGSLLLPVGLVACEDHSARESESLRRDLEETRRKAAKDVEDARAKASADVAEKERELAEARARQAARTEDLTYADRDEYRDLRRRELVGLDDEITELERRAAKATGDAKRELEEALADVKRRREQLRTSIERVGDSTEKEWDEAKRAVDEAVSDLRKRIRDAWDSTKKKT